MYGTLPQKVSQSVNTLITAESAAEGTLKQTQNQINRGLVTTPAAIGLLAISMSTSSMLVTQQVEVAMAAELGSGTLPITSVHQDSVTVEATLSDSSAEAKVRDGQQTASNTNIGIKGKTTTDIAEGQSQGKVTPVLGNNFSRETELIWANHLNGSEAKGVNHTITIPQLQSTTRLESLTLTPIVLFETAMAPAPLSLSEPVAQNTVLVATGPSQATSVFSTEAIGEGLTLDKTLTRPVNVLGATAEIQGLPELGLVAIAPGWEAIQDKPPAALPRHRVRDGETISQIALRYGVSIEELLQANQLTSGNFIKVNQLLIIPATQEGSEDTPVTVMLSENDPVRASQTFTEQADNPNSTFTFDESPDQVRITVNSPTEGPRGTSPEGDMTTSAVSGSEGTSTNQAANGQYIDGLMNEIKKMRQSQETNSGGLNIEPEPSRESEPQVVLSNIESEQSQPQVVSPVIPETTTRVVPQTNGERNTGPERVATAPLGSQPQVVSPVIPETTTRVVPQTNGERNTGPEQVATAPLGPRTYNGSMIFDRTILPLPPLRSPDRYLPEETVPFNGYIWPAKGTLTSGFGWRWGRMHKGIDIAGPIGTPIFAAGHGVVDFAGWNRGGYGNLVEIRHPDGSLTRYAHNHRILVRKGDRVKQGQQIAEMGSTGYSTGPHLHFEIHPEGRGPDDPKYYLSQRP